MFRILTVPALLTAALVGCDAPSQAVGVDLDIQIEESARAQVTYPAVLVAGLVVHSEEMQLETFEIVEVLCDADDLPAQTTAHLESAWGPCHAARVEASAFLAPLSGGDCDTPLDEAWWTADAEVAEAAREVVRLDAVCGTWDRRASVTLR